jgi:hypothetical protein
MAVVTVDSHHESGKITKEKKTWSHKSLWGTVSSDLISSYQTILPKSSNISPLYHPGDQAIKAWVLWGTFDVQIVQIVAVLIENLIL